MSALRTNELFKYPYLTRGGQNAWVTTAYFSIFIGAFSSWHGSAEPDRISPIVICPLRIQGLGKTTGYR